MSFAGRRSNLCLLFRAAKIRKLGPLELEQIEQPPPDRLNDAALDQRIAIHVRFLDLDKFFVPSTKNLLVWLWQERAANRAKIWKAAAEAGVAEENIDTTLKAIVGAGCAEEINGQFQLTPSGSAVRRPLDLPKHAAAPVSSQTKAEADLFSEKELRALLARAENPLVERKTEGDFKDIRRTAVAFANSLPVGVPGIIFYPAKDDGTAEKQLNLDSVQKKIGDQLKRPFPPLLFTFRVVEALGIDVLAIIVFGSETRPHFSDRSFVRRGSQTFEASVRSSIGSSLSGIQRRERFSNRAAAPSRSPR